MNETLRSALEACKTPPYLDWRVELLAVIDQKIDLYKRVLPGMYRETSAHVMCVQDALMRLMSLRSNVRAATYRQAFEVLQVCDQADDGIREWSDAGANHAQN